MVKFFSVLFDIFSIVLLILVGNTIAFGYYQLSAVCFVLAGLFAGLADEFV